MSAFTPGDNPLKSVGGISLKPPDAEDGYKWDLEDVSASDAGRTEDVKMQKKRIGQVDAISLKWSGLTTAEISAILKAFNPEYITVEYLSPLEGGFVTKEFYVGNRSAPMYSSALNLWENVTFKIIARGG